MRKRRAVLAMGVARTGRRIAGARRKARSVSTAARWRSRVRGFVASTARSRSFVAAIGVDVNGDKHPLGLVEGATENAATVQALIDNLVERGLDPAVPRLFIIDGSKALSKAIRATFGRDAAIQRCQIWPPSASPGVDASLLRASHLRMDHRSSQWHGRGDFEAAGGAFADGQTRMFRAEDEAVLKAGLCGAYVTVDDTGARHAGKNGYTTQIGSYNFTTFRTGPSKSRLAFLSRLCGGCRFM